jgi:hypothetical protein
MEQWENPEWEDSSCQIQGSGKYRFNQYGTDGYAWRQFRFKTKDAAMNYLSMFTLPLQRVMPDQPQYNVQVWDTKTRTVVRTREFRETTEPTKEADI